jgi:hypothetical protein
MSSRIRKQLILAAFLVFFLGVVAVADSATLRKRLEREVEVALADVTIAEALEQIGEQAGITIELSHEAIWELPEGAETRLDVTLEGQLDQSLAEMLNAFFLRYAVGSDAVEIYPRPELMHIMGRPTVETLELLRKIYTNHLYLEGDSESIKKLSHSFVNQVVGTNVSILPLRVSKHVASVVQELVAEGQGMVSVFLAPVLDEVTERLSGVYDQWVVCAPEFPGQFAQIKFMSHKERLAAGLNRVVDVSFEKEPGLRILKHLAVMADIELSCRDDDRDWLDQEISIDALNVTVSQALSRVTAALGGEGTVTPEGSYEVWAVAGEPPASPAETAAARARMAAMARARTAAARRAALEPEMSDLLGTTRDDYVGKISIPMDGGRYFIEFMLRESDLTDELRQLRAERIKEILNALSDAAEKTATP